MFGIAHGAACGALLVATVRMNLARLVELEGPGTQGLARYARVGRILADLPSTTDDPAAHEALLDILRRWTTTLGTPRLGALGFDREHVEAVLAGISTSSMSTNPVMLAPADLAAILDASA
jgi:alcohol dehydrogenase class IV